MWICPDLYSPPAPGAQFGTQVLVRTVPVCLQSVSMHTILLQPVGQSAPAHAQIARGLGLIAPTPFERLQNHLFLHGIQADTVLRQRKNRTLLPVVARAEEIGE